MNNAFLGIENLYSPDSLKKIKNSHFAIIGVGGVGSWIAEFLVRSGAELITLIDLDEICVTNLNRQIQTHSKNIGVSKIEAMKSRLMEINPEVKVNTIHDFLTSSTVDSIFNTPFDFVFDAIDSVSNKCLIIQKCKKLKIPFVITGAAGARMNPTLIEIRDLNRTINDKLLFRVKKKLKKDYGYSKNTKRIYRIPVVFSTEVPQKDQNTCGSVSNCESGLGSAGFVTSAFASAAVSYSLKKILA